jgi:hypothetical protein
MNHVTPRSAQLEWLLADTLHYGTWLASAAIGLGLALALIDSRFSAPKLTILRDMRIATIGIALFILLPVVRVIVMLIVYFRQRDYRLGAIALLVLTIILLGLAVGLGGKQARQYTNISDAGERRDCSASPDASYLAGVKFFPQGGAAYLPPPRVFSRPN